MPGVLRAVPSGKTNLLNPTITSWDRMQTWNLVFDIDFTLTGDLPSLRKLGQKLQRLQQVGQARVLFCTGRPYPDVLHGLKHEELPQPDAIIAQTGVELYLPPFGSFSTPLLDWQLQLEKFGFSAEEVHQRLIDLNDVISLEAANCQTPYKVSYAIMDPKQPLEWLAEISRRMMEPVGRYQVICAAFGESYYVDILPGMVNKGKALRYLLELLKWQEANTIVAGDSGNDQSMFDEGFKGILVGNARPEVKEYLQKFPAKQFYQAQQNYAKGVLEGLAHWQVSTFDN